MRVVTKKHIADVLNVSIRTIDFWIAKGILPKPTHIGRRCYWQPDELDTWLTGRLSQPLGQHNKMGS